MRVLIIDSMNMIHRARYGFGKGENNVTFGFFRCLKSEIKRHEAEAVYIVLEGFPRHRKEIYESYKGNRKKETDSNFIRQRDEIFELCKSLPVYIVRHPDFECDDVISMLCRKIHVNDNVTICSSDSDFIQLLDMPNVKLWNPVRKKFIDKWPVDYCTWKSLKGDATDNIAGVKGIGEKTAYKLASDSSLLRELFDKKPQAAQDFNLSMELIKFAELDPKDNKLEFNSYNFNEDHLLGQFKARSFKSIVGKSWSSWTTTMEFLDERIQSAGSH